VCSILRFRVLFVFFWFCPVLRVLVMSLGSCSVSLGSYLVFIDIFKFLLRKEE